MGVVQAFILIQTEVGRAALVAATIAEIPGVASAEEVSGPYDVIVRVDAADATQLNRDVVPTIQQVDGITRTLTCPVVPDTGRPSERT
ncbi:Lrp/AsnC ligand binding domain-containing protein [Gordonia sinesedis]